jgi:hypothetical protein
MRYWNLYLTYPAVKKLHNGEDHSYNANQAIGVIAETLQGAIALALEAHPEATLWSVTHRGEVHLPQVIEFKDFDAEHYKDTHATKAAGLS